MRPVAVCVCSLILAGLPLTGLAQPAFIENKGQIRDQAGHVRPDVRFYADCAGGRLYFFEDHLSFVSWQQPAGSTRLTGKRTDYSLRSGYAPVGTDKPEAYTNFYYPHCAQGLKVKSYRSIRYVNQAGETGLVFSVTDQGKIICTGAERLDPAAAAASACASWSTYYGGSGTDEAWGITCDNQHNSYVAGYTLSADFPVSAGSFQDTVSGFYDAVVIKMDSCGNRVWTTFIGSTANDFGEKISMSRDRIAVLGHTTGSDLPVGNAGWQQSSNGSYDAFLFRLDESGARLWGTYFGGSGGELGFALATDTAGNIFFGGSTSSNDLPVLNAFQASTSGALDAYVAKFDTAGQRQWCTYYGGSASDDVHSMSADDSGNVIVAGGSYSTDLSVTGGAYQPQNNGFSDGYLLKLDASGSRIFSTYFGGNGAEDINGACTDAQNNIYITGYTASSDLPVSGGAFQQNHAGADDIFITRFGPAGSLDWCTYYGGQASEQAYAIAGDKLGHFFVLAVSDSTDTPVIGTPLQAGSGGGTDAFIVKISSLGQVQWSTYYGGSSHESGYHLYADSAMRVYITGRTSSVDFPVSAGAHQSAAAGAEDIFMARLDGSFDTTTSIALLEPENAVSVFPNPATDRCRFLLPGPAEEMMISDQLGNVRARICPGGKREVYYDTRHLQQGLYLVSVRTGAGVYTIKLLIAR